MRLDIEYDYLIVGGGLAGVSAVDGIRDVDPEGTILVMTEESEPPYQRPPLSKEYVRFPEATRDLLYIKPAGWFGEQEGIRLETRQRALVLDPAAMRITTARGNEYRGGRILLATGGRARTLDVPGADLGRVLTLRDVEDSEVLRELAREGGRVALVGAGFIGMELAASLTGHGAEPLVIEPCAQVWPRVLPPSLAGWLQMYCAERGVVFRLGERVLGFRGRDRVEAVCLDGEEWTCDLAVVGVGMEPNQHIADDAGLAVADGIMVDAYGETSHANVYAAGDVARFPDPVFGGTARIEHWEHAREHGRLTGRNMAGARERYGHLSYFFSDVFDLELNVVGRPTETEELVLRGTPGEGPCIAFGLRKGRLHAAVLIDAAPDLEPCRALVSGRPRAASLVADLARPDVPLAGLLE
jgi:3-phenylpropionate/trans-cinnamate dioxygenase ferredoxin reductase subunit